MWEREREREREREQFQSQINNLITQLEQARVAFQESKKAAEETEEKLLDDLLKLHAKLEHEKEAHEDTEELGRRQMTLMNGCLQQLENQIKRLKDDKDILIKQAAEQQEIINEHKQFEKAQKNKINQLQELLTAANKESSKQQIKHQKKQDKLTKKLQRTQIRLAKLQADKQGLKSEYEQEQKIIAKLILKNQNYQQIIKQKDQQLKSKRIEINQGKRKVINNLRKEIQQLQKQVQQEKNRADNLQVWKDNHVCFCPKICCVNGDYATIKQQLDNHECPTVDNSEVERLLTVVAEKEQVIRELEIKLAMIEPQIIKVENGEVKELRNELAKQEKRIERLHLIYLLILSAAALVGVVNLVRSKIRGKKPR